MRTSGSIRRQFPPARLINKLNATARSVDITATTATITVKEEATFKGKVIIEDLTVEKLTLLDGMPFNTGSCICGRLTEEKPGPVLSWDSKTLCFDCIRDVVIHHEAKTNWANKNGDPVISLQTETTDLKKEITDLKAELTKLKEVVAELYSNIGGSL
jgi:hypothetical protein